MADHILRRHDPAIDDVVGDVQQALDEQLVAGHALGLHRIAVATGRRLLDDEAALGADRHDHRVLHHLRLDQAQHLGAEILATVGPAQATAGHRAEAQVHALHPRAVDKDLAVRARPGHVRHLGRIELEADAVARLAIGIGLVVAGAKSRVDGANEAAQDAVIVQAGDPVEQLQQCAAGGGLLGGAIGAARIDHFLQHLDHVLVTGGQHPQLLDQALLPGQHFGLRLAAGGRMEARLEQFHQHPRQQRIAAQGLFNVVLRERHAGLQQVFPVAAQQRHLAPFQAGGQDQAVEAVVLGPARPDRGEGAFEQRCQPGHVDRAGQRLDLEILHVDRLAATLGQVGMQPVGMLGMDPQAHVLHQRQHVRQRDVVVPAVQLQAQAGAALARDLVQAQAQVLRPGQRGQLLHVVGRQFRRHVFDVAGRQGAAIGAGQAQALGFAVAGHQQFAQVVLPVAQQVRQPALQLGGVHLHAGAAARAHDQVQLRQRRLAQHDAGIDLVADQRLLQQRLDAQAHVGVEALPRHVDQGREEPAIAVAAQEQAAAHPLLQAEHADGGAVELFLGRLEQFLARQRLQDVAQGLAAVAVGRQAAAAHDVFEAFTHQRDLPRAAVVGGRGVHAQEALLADDDAVGVELEHADVVHVALAVDPRATVGLGQDQRLGGASPVQAMGGQRLHRPRAGGVLAAHQTQARAFHRGQHHAAALLDHLVFAVAVQGEVIGRGPAQELLRLAPDAVFHRHAPGGQVIGQHLHALAHQAPVGHHRAHLGQHLAHALLDGAHRRRHLAVDLQQHQRLGLALAHRLQLAGRVAAHAHQRMAQHVHAHAHLGQGHAHRINQERHVVIDDLQHRVL